MPASLAVSGGGRQIPACHPQLSDWEGLTRIACRAQADHRFEHALAGHVRALWVVEALLEGSLLRTHPDDCLAALVVSHHSLSELYRHRGQRAPAVAHLCAPHQLLLRLASHAHACVQQAAWRHLRETRAALLDWQARHGAEARIDECLQCWPQPALAGAPGYRH